MDKFAAAPYALVLMDLNMPVMDGFTATRAMREIERQRGLPHTFIVALTASAFEDAAHDALAAGCDQHLAKPVKKAALLEIVRKCAAQQAPRPVRLRSDIRPAGACRLPVMP